MNDIKTGTISITGLADLERRLLDFPDKLARNVLRGAIRAGTAVFRKEAQRICPQSAEAHYLGKGSKRVLIQPGDLKKKGIKIRLAPRNSRTQPVEYWVYVSRRNWYWKFVEFGTVKMSAKPFMRPAFDTKKEEAIEAVKRYLGERIEKEAAKGGY